MPRKKRWQHIADIIELGGHLTVASEGAFPVISNLECDGQMVCMLETSGMGFETIMDRIDELAKRFHEEGIATDEVNGDEFCVW
ncbi:MAG: hypothetical protein FKY71_16650 [Spiribacter salinus]|uniref:Uncharacterized protein n=1 Tax=Spiribacter salinus TaxID=1335746 RepID=A0A540VK54_9GAMM|nr:MAG: hypothetical protein FKY71_16650 [Spiribacter salinus]